MATGISAGKPTTVNTYIGYIADIGTQTEQTGTSSIVVPNALISLGSGPNYYYGFIGTKYTTYVGRCIILNIAGTLQRRVVISQANGTGTLKILTVNRPWDTTPATGNTLHVSYDMDDLETGGSNTGVALGARTGTYDWTGVLNIGDGTQYAGLYMGAGEAGDMYDGGAVIGTLVLNNARLDVGYRNNQGSTISGGVFLFTQNTDAEPTIQFQAGSKGEINDTLIWAQIKSLFLENAATSAISYRGTKFLSTTYGTTFFGSSLYTCSISGRSNAAGFIRFNANSTVDGLVLSQTAGITGTNDTSTEVITLKGVTFVNNLALLVINSNKTFNMINPVWSATTYTNFTWTTTTANYVYDKRSVEPTVQDTAGSPLQNAMVVVYEGTILADLVVKTPTNSSGAVSTTFNYKLHSTNSSTVTYGTHALRIDKWLYTPFVASQTSTAAVTGTYTLVSDPNIVETNQTTALSAGGTMTWNIAVNPSVILEYTGGTGTLLVGMIITGASSTKYGTVTKIVDGDSTAGTIHLSAVSATSVFTGGETISRTGGTAGTWSAIYTAATEQKFSIWIDGKDLTMQTEYDYLAAVTSDTALTAPFEVIHEWGRNSQGRALYSTGSSFYTERSNSKGIFITNYGAGTIDYFTDDAGGTWTPPTTVAVTVTIKNQAGTVLPGVEVAIFQNDTARTVVLTSTATNASGEVVTSTTPNLGGIIIRARQSTNIMSFLTSESTTNGVNSTLEEISNTTFHNFQTGDAVVYGRNGGSASISGSITDGNTYYVREVDTTSVKLYASAANAISDTGAFDLTASGSETHKLDPIRFVAGSATGTVGTTDFSTTITLITDNIATG
ncbi:MAG: hypothetical protein Q8P29_01250 [Candidatus Levybacteria bacterium]|nr:hypothetical protein [Candidatus Levybacteria bacterium]